MAVVNQLIACVRCGTSLLGRELAETCAGCGEPVALSLDVARVDLQTGTLSVSTPCVGCGYDLRTLHAEGVCPECGTPVLRSLRDGSLRLANPDWLDRLRLGVALALSGCGMILLAIVLELIFTHTDIAPLLLGLAGLAGLGGIALFAKPEPFTTASASSARSNRLAFWAAILSPVLGLLAYATWMPNAHSYQGIAKVLADIQRPLGFLATYTACAIAVICGTFCLRRLALREHERAQILRRATTAFIWLGTVTAVLPVMGSTAMLVDVVARAGGFSSTSAAPTTTAPAMGLVFSPAESFMIAVACLSMPLHLGCFIFGAILLFCYRAMLTRVIESTASTELLARGPIR